MADYTLKPTRVATNLFLLSGTSHWAIVSKPTRSGTPRSPLTKKVQSKTPRWQTLVADTRALIAAWTGALDVRRVAPERRANEFPLEPGAHALPISVPRAVRKPRRLRSKPGFEGKGAFDLVGHQLLQQIALSTLQTTLGTKRETCDSEGGGAHLHRDADCGAAQVANQRRKPQGELRASPSRPLVWRQHDSPGILMRDPARPQRSTLMSVATTCGCLWPL